MGGLLDILLLTVIVAFLGLVWYGIMRRQERLDLLALKQEEDSGNSSEKVARRGRKRSDE